MSTNGRPESEQPSDEFPAIQPRRVDLEIDGQPYSKARPRVTSRGTYTPRVQKENAEMLAWELRLAVGRPFEGNVKVGLVFYRSNNQRIDLDNLIKQVLDAANGVVWADDAQVTMIVARKRCDPTRPRTVISIADDNESNVTSARQREREATCERCAQPFRYMPFPSQAPQRFCSRSCRRTGVCEECGATYEKSSQIQRYCSKRCSATVNARSDAARAARKRRAKGPLPKCRDCGADLKRHGAVLCRTCWLASPKKRTKATA